MNRIGRRTAYAHACDSDFRDRLAGARIAVGRLRYSASGVRVGEDLSSLRSSC